MMIQQLAVIFAAILLTSLQAKQCHKSCMCQGDLIDCNGAHLSEFPTITAQLKTVQIMGGSLGIKNLSSSDFKVDKDATVLRMLLVNCGIERVEKSAFMKLRQHLKVILLTAETIENEAFAGLSLNKLELDGLRIIQERSFDRMLSLKHLILKNSSIKQFPLRSLLKLAKDGGLRELQVVNNAISTLDVSYDELFEEIDKVSLVDNPWHCDCRIGWLIRRYRIKKYKEDPVCASPPKLKGMRFSSLFADEEELKYSNLSDFERDNAVIICPRLELNTFEIDMREMTNKNIRGSLSCNITGAKGLQVQWSHFNTNRNSMEMIPPNLSAVKNIQTFEELSQLDGPKGLVSVSDVYKIHSTLSVKRQNELDTYTCTGKDPFNNFSASILVRWPDLPVQYTEAKPIPGDRNDFTDSTVFPPKSRGSVFEKQFSLIELLGAILGTFLFTTLLFIIGFHFMRSYYAGPGVCLKGGKSYMSGNGAHVQSPNGTDSSHTSSGLNKLEDHTVTKGPFGQHNGEVLMFGNGLMVANSHANQLNHLQAQPLMSADTPLYDIPRNVGQGSQNSLKQSSDSAAYGGLFPVMTSDGSGAGLAQLSPHGVHIAGAIPPPPSTPQPALPSAHHQQQLQNHLYNTMLHMGTLQQTPQFANLNGMGTNGGGRLPDLSGGQCQL